MQDIKYLDFDLRIEKIDDVYRVRVLNSPAGQAHGEFEQPFTDLEVENFWLRISRPRTGVRRLESPEMQAARDIGAKLFDAVFNDEIRGRLRSSQSEARARGAGLRFRLHLSAVPEFAEFPWEYIYDSSLDEFLVLSVHSPLVRYLDLPRRTTPLTTELPLQILVMISSPTDFPQLDVEKEFNNLKAGLADLEERGLVFVDRLEDGSLSMLQRQLRRKQYHVFHYIGHGGFDEKAQDGILILEDENGRGRAVNGGFLGTLLHDSRALSLALLNACEGARSSRTDPFAGVAHSLVQHGIPAVIAMHNEITDEAAIVLAHEFYGAIADGYPVDAALSEARKAIFAQNNDIEWGTPVLYLRSLDGKIFHVKPARKPTELREPTIPSTPPPAALPAAEGQPPPAEPAPAPETQAAPRPIAQSTLPVHQPAPVPGQVVHAAPSPAYAAPTRRAFIAWLVGIVGVVSLALAMLFAFNGPNLFGLGTATPGPTQSAPTPSTVIEPSSTPVISASPTQALAQVETPEPTPTEAETPTPTDTPDEGIVLPPDGDVIAFASERTGRPQIWFLVLGQDEPIQLTNKIGGACQPAWKPDGTQLVFISPCQGNQTEYPNSALYMIDANGTGENKLTLGAGGDYDPHWSSTDRIVFTSLRGALAQIYVLDLDGDSVPTQLTRSTPNFKPAWSPDGSTIAFVSNRLGPAHVFTMPALGEIASEGSRARQFTRNDAYNHNQPSWSPNGQLLIYTRQPKNGIQPEICGGLVKDIGLKEFIVSTEAGKGPMNEPDFSNDGQWIIFEGWPDGENHDIWRMDLNGDNRERLTFDPALDFDAVWRP